MCAPLLGSISRQDASAACGDAGGALLYGECGLFLWQDRQPQPHTGQVWRVSNHGERGEDWEETRAKSWKKNSLFLLNFVIWFQRYRADLPGLNRTDEMSDELIYLKFYVFAAFKKIIKGSPSLKKKEVWYDLRILIKNIYQWIRHFHAGFMALCTSVLDLTSAGQFHFNSWYKWHQ